MTLTEAIAVIDQSGHSVHITTSHDLAKALDALGLIADLAYPPEKPEVSPTRNPNKSMHD